jgi:glucosamine kinase
MILIVESGSTKSDWVLVNDSQIIDTFSTVGINPYFHNEEFIRGVVDGNPGLATLKSQVHQIHFYGAGCSSEALNQVVHRGLKSLFQKAEVAVDHDLKACAYALYEGEPMIACILGTGSNSCYFDGEDVFEAVPALGFILGDEGSGSYYGKQILSGYLYHTLPADLQRDFDATYGISKDEIIDHVYRKPNANVYIASYMRFFVAHKNHPFVRERVEEGMRRFLKIHVLCFEKAQRVPVSFVGSVAHFFGDILSDVASDLGIQLGTIIRKPIDALVQHHIDLAYNKIKG